jgi:hypothetical protein
VAEQNSTPAPDKNFTQMSLEELADLIRKEGDNYIAQTGDGDIEPEEYLEAEKFTQDRLFGTYFAFEYFLRTEHGKKSEKSPAYDKPEYLDLYALLHARIEETTEMNLFGSEYIIKL